MWQQSTLSIPEEGQLVQVRSRQWVVNKVKPSSLPLHALKPTFSGPQSLVMLSSVEDDGLGEELQVVWEIEPGARVIEKVALPEPTGFDPPEKLDAFLDAVRWGAASTADLKNIQAPFRSGVETEDQALRLLVHHFEHKLIQAATPRKLSKDCRKRATANSPTGRQLRNRLLQETRRQQVLSCQESPRFSTLRARNDVAHV